MPQWWRRVDALSGLAMERLHWEGQHAEDLLPTSIGINRVPAVRFGVMPDGIAALLRAEHQIEQTNKRLGND